MVLFQNAVDVFVFSYGHKLMDTTEISSLLNSYGYSKERFVWSLISAVGIFCLGSGATIVNGIQNLWTSQVIDHLNLNLASNVTIINFILPI